MTADNGYGAKMIVSRFRRAVIGAHAWCANGSYGGSATELLGEALPGTMHFAENRTYWLGWAMRSRVAVAFPRLPVHPTSWRSAAAAGGGRPQRLVGRLLLGAKNSSTLDAPRSDLLESAKYVQHG